jgi:hypothetical protein
MASNCEITDKMEKIRKEEVVFQPRFPRRNWVPPEFMSVLIRKHSYNRSGQCGGKNVTVCIDCCHSKAVSELAFL